MLHVTNMVTTEQPGAKRARPDGDQAGPSKRPTGDDVDDMINESFEEMDDDVEEFMPTDLEIDEGTLGLAGKNWQRPQPPQLNPATDSLGTIHMTAFLAT